MPLLDLRNALDFRSGGRSADDQEDTDRHLRDFRRMSGTVQIMVGDRPIPGPYTQYAREMWLTKLLTAQKYVRLHAPISLRNISLISLDELQEIRRIWVIDKHEIEDSLPRIYREVTGEEYPGRPLDDNMVLGEDEMKDLEGLCQGERLHYELTRELLSLTRQQRSSARRAGLFNQLEKTFRRHYYDDEADAVGRARHIASERRKQDDRRRVGVAESSAMFGEVTE